MYQIVMFILLALVVLFVFASIIRFGMHYARGGKLKHKHKTYDYIDDDWVDWREYLAWYQYNDPWALFAASIFDLGIGVPSAVLWPIVLPPVIATGTLYYLRQKSLRKLEENQ